MPSPLYDDEDTAGRARAIEALKKKLPLKKKSPLYDKGREEWQAQPSGIVSDKDNAAGSPDNKGTVPAGDDVQQRVNQFKANVGRDMPPRWRSIKTVGVKA